MHHTFPAAFRQFATSTLNSYHLEEMLDDGSFRAIAEGIWVTHEDVNPATGEVRDKHFWLVEHDGLVFGSGRHHDESGG